MARDRGRPPFSLEGESILPKEGVPSVQSVVESRPGDAEAFFDQDITPEELAPEKPLYALSGDELRDKQTSIEARLRTAFVSIPDNTLAEFETVTDGVLSPTLWYKLQRKAEVKLAQLYHNIEIELERRKLENV